MSATHRMYQYTLPAFVDPLRPFPGRTHPSLPPSRGGPYRGPDLTGKDSAGAIEGQKGRHPRILDA